MDKKRVVSKKVSSYQAGSCKQCAELIDSLKEARKKNRSAFLQGFAKGKK